MENKENQPPENKQDFPDPKSQPDPVVRSDRTVPMPPKIELHISFNTLNGQMAVHFPFEHKRACIEILAEAIKAVLNAQPPSAIVPATQLPPGIKMLFPQNGNGKSRG